MMVNMTSRWQLLALLLLVPAMASAQTVGQIGKFNVTTGDTNSIVITGPSADGPVVVWQTSGTFLKRTVHDWGAEDAFGMFVIHDKSLCTASNNQDFTVSFDQNCMVYSGQLTGGGAPCGNMNFTLHICALAADLSDQLQFTIDTPPDPKHIVSVTLETYSSTDEMVFGFGEQYSRTNTRNLVIPIMTSEQGVGRGLPIITEAVNLNTPHAGGNWHTTYAGIPHYVTSSLRSFWLENTEPSEFDVAHKHRTTISCKVLNHQLVARVAYVDPAVGKPLDVIAEFTKYSGRMMPLPDWITSGSIVGYEGGTEALLALHARLKSKGIRPAAYWVQDWSGERTDAFGKRLWWNWELDTTLYNNWTSLLQTLRADGVEIMTYINPYLADTVTRDKPDFKTDLFRVAAELDYLVKNESGLPYILSSGSPTFTFGTVDLSNPAAASWFSNVIFENMLKIGIAGFMCDFGEYLPLDSVLNTSTPIAYHNQYPEAWARTARNATDAYLNATQFQSIFFTRAAFTRSAGATTLMWAGDQLTTWDKFDGLETVLLAGLNGGLSGLAMTHSDLGGYTMLSEGPFNILRTPELLFRWMELSSVADAVFRSHPGNLPSKSTQVYSDNSTLACFQRLGRLHTALAAYRQALMVEAFDRGSPLMRYMFLEFGMKSSVANVYDQFMLGSDVLAAPVLAKKHHSRKVVIPPGHWVHLWSGSVYTGEHNGPEIEVLAPLGEPPVFYKQGSTVGLQLVSALPAIKVSQCSL